MSINNKNPYGQPLTTQPQYGQPQAQPQYGQPQAPSFGQPEFGQPAFGQPQTDTQKMDVVQFIQGAIELIRNGRMNPVVIIPALENYILQAGYVKDVQFGTNRISIDIPVTQQPNVVQYMQVRPQPGTKLVAKLPYLDLANIDNIREYNISKMVDGAGVLATSYGLLFNNIVLIQEQLTRIDSKESLSNNRPRLRNWYTACTNNGILISDASVDTFRNFGTTSTGQLKSLDYAYFGLMLTEPINTANLDHNPIRCNVCGSPMQLEAELLLGDDHTATLPMTITGESYKCTNKACVNHERPISSVVLIRQGIQGLDRVM